MDWSYHLEISLAWPIVILIESSIKKIKMQEKDLESFIEKFNLLHKLFIMKEDFPDVYRMIQTFLVEVQ